MPEEPRVKTPRPAKRCHRTRGASLNQNVSIQYELEIIIECRRHGERSFGRGLVRELSWCGRFGRTCAGCGGEGVIHGILAFFSGLLVLIVVGAAVRLWQGVRQKGARWLVSREGLRVYGWTGLFVVSAIALFYAAESWRGKRAWASAVEQAKALGEPLSYHAIIPPSVPDDENFANAPIFKPLFGEKPVGMTSLPAGRGQEKYLVFTERLSPPRKDWHARELPWLNQERVDVHAWAEYYAGTNLPDIREEEAAKMLLEAFQRYAGIFNQVREFSTRPYCRFPMAYEGSGMLAGSHLVTMRDLIRLLGERGSAELILGKGDEALADARLALRLVAYSRQQPSAFSSRLNLVLGALQPVWEGLGSRRWNEQQITELQNQLQALDWLSDYPMAIRMDRLYLAALVGNDDSDDRIKCARSGVGNEPGGQTVCWNSCAGFIQSGGRFKTRRRSTAFTLGGPRRRLTADNN